MFTYRKLLVALALTALTLAVCSTAILLAQQVRSTGSWQDPATAIKVSLPPEVPLSIASIDVSDTDIYTRGGALVIDLGCQLVVRNESPTNVRGVTFAVLAQQLTAGGKASVALPTLNVAPAQTFPVRLNLRLLRPLPPPLGPLVEVVVDGVLLSDFSFFGPDQLDSRRKMTVWEMEARRDRQYFKALLNSGGPEQLRSVMLAGLARQTSRPRLEARLAGQSGRSVSSAVRSAETRIALAFLELPESPLELVSGSATVDGPLASSPSITVKNRSEKAVRYFELGWLVTDQSGTRYAAGSVPGPGSHSLLPPGGTAVTTQDRHFLFTPKPAGVRLAAFAVAGMTGYVNQVQFEDGSFWIPSRTGLEKSALINTIALSAEEQRLVDLYRNKGLKALIEELEKF